MEQIILNTNLRFVTAGLAAEQKGAAFAGGCWRVTGRRLWERRLIFINIL